MGDATLLIDGRPGEHVGARDRGLAYGDGVFRTMAVSEGVPELWTRHMAKLAADCAALGLPAPDAGLLAREAAQVLAGHDRAVLKIIVTRGEGGRGYKPPEPARPTRIVLRAPWPDYSPALAAEGVAMRLCDTRLGLQPRLAGVKHLNRLEQVLARDEWSDPAIAEGLMLDSDGRAIEGVISNLFAVRRERVVTPELTRCGVAGVMRALVLDLAKDMALSPVVADLPLDELRAADEIFLTNSLIGVWPVRQFDGHNLRIGPVARRLAAAVATARSASREEFPR